MARSSAQLAPGTKFYVTSWDTGAILAEYETPGAARNDAKARGFIESRLTGKMPVAYVAADYLDKSPVIYGHAAEPAVIRGCFYNPRFK